MEAPKQLEVLIDVPNDLEYGEQLCGGCNAMLALP